MSSSTPYRFTRVLPRSHFLLLVLCITVLSFSCSESPEQVYQRLDTEAEQAIADRRYGRAISIWNDLLARQPEAVGIYPKLARSYQLCGLYPQALQALRQDLSQNPGSPATLLHIMQLQIQLLDIAGAGTSWDALHILPPNSMSLTSHGDLLAAQKQFLPAIDEYKKALALDPSNQQALARLAVILQGQQHRGEAEVIYQKLEAQHPKAPEILLQMGNYWLLLGEREKADLFLQEAIKHVPEDQNLRIKLAELYIDAGRFIEAATLFKELLHKAPTNRFYKKMLFESLLLGKQFRAIAELQADLSEAENDDIDFLLLKGKYYLNTGKYLVAASQLELALAKEPNHPLALYFLALANFADGRNNFGRSCLIKSLTLNPHFTEAELTLAACYYKTGDYEIALEHVARIQKREPEYYRSFLLQGSILLALKKYDGALEAFRKAYVLNPNTPTPQYYLGVLSSFTGKPEQTLSLLDSLLAGESLLADATLLYIQALCTQGENDKALGDLEEFIAAHPGSPYLHHIHGLALLSTGKKQEAIEAFKTALHLAPDMKESYLQLFKIYQNISGELEKILLEALSKINNFEEAQTRLAALYRTNGQPEKAITLLQDALARTPSSPLLANNLACLYLEYQPDKINEAMRLAALAYDKVSDNAAIVDTLGWAYYKKNNLTRAGWLLKEALVLEPDNPIILEHIGAVRLALEKKP